MAFKMKGPSGFKHKVSLMAGESGKRVQKLHSFDFEGHRHIEGYDTTETPTQPKKKKKK